MPVKLVAHTGMDAMTHAIEAYVSTANCNYTDPLAIHAIELIQANLVKSYNGDMAARDTMHDAQCLAGQSFSNALLGIVHSMAIKQVLLSLIKVDILFMVQLMQCIYQKLLLSTQKIQQLKNVMVSSLITCI